MLTQPSLWSYFFLLIGAIATSVQNSESSPFTCTGGSIYFSAHPVDVLLFQNPDLSHDLYVYKCVTTIVFTSAYRSSRDDSQLSAEHGLGHAYSQMAGVPVHSKCPLPNATNVHIGEHDVVQWSPRDMPNVQILYLRLPDGGHAGQGHNVFDRESLKKLYSAEVESVTTTDGNTTYTLDSLQSLIATILLVRQANDIKMLHHKASFPDDENDADSEHADHTVSAKFVMDIINKENITSNVHLYAGAVIRSFEANLHSKSNDFERKAQAYLRYAEHDENMCGGFEACENRLHDKEADRSIDHDATYVALYLGREYYVA